MIELRPAKYLLGRLVPMDNNDKIPLFNLGSGTYDNTKFLRGDGTWAVPSGGGGSYVPYTGATSDVNLGEYGLSTGWVQIDTTPTTYTPGVGKIGWNDQDGTLEFQLKGGNVTLQIGQEQVSRVVNKTDPLIDLLEANYQVVKITGAQGNRLKIALAQANNDANSAETLGVVTENIPGNQEGFITTSGLVRNINTTGSLQGETWADGDMLYLSGTIAGQITKVKPSAPIHTVILGYVVRAHATQGQIYVKIDNGYELGELHDVNTNLSKATPVDTDSLLLQDTADSNIWKKLSWLNTKATLKTYFDTLYQAAGSYVPTSRTITINSTTQDLSTDRSWSIDKTSVGLGNVDNTSDADKPVSTAQATAIGLKQDTLVSGTNIKTVNSTSLLGSGNVSVQPTLVSGTNIKTINGSSVLGSGDLVVSGSSSLGIHALMPPFSGKSYMAMITYGALTGVISSANFVRLYPFIPARNITISSTSINVTSLVAGVNTRILIYDDSNGLPNSKLIESTDLSCSTSGVKTFTTTYTFTAGTVYWIGNYSSGAPSFSHLPVANMLMMNNLIAGNTYTGVFYSYTFGSAPASLNGVSPTYSNGQFPAIMLNI